MAEMGCHVVGGLPQSGGVVFHVANCTVARGAKNATQLQLLMAMVNDKAACTSANFARTPLLEGTGFPVCKPVRLSFWATWPLVLFDRIGASNLL